MSVLALLHSALAGIISLFLAISGSWSVFNPDTTFPATDTPSASIQRDIPPQTESDARSGEAPTEAEEPPLIEIRPEEKELPEESESSTPQTSTVSGTASESSLVETEQVPPPPSFTEINTATRTALVNILCTTTAGSPINGASGTGTIITNTGVVITNAHVAQYYLLLDQLSLGSIDCILRTGSPARNTYRAELMYLPPAWIKDNAHKIVEAAPTGTGEYDFAILHITNRIDGGPVGATPFISPDASEPDQDEPVLLAGYAAGFLGNLLITRDLTITSAITTVQKLFTFGGGDVDLVSVGGTVVSQKGSSGGAVVDAKGNLRGVIVTSSAADNTSDRELRALTLAHVDRVLLAGTGNHLSAFIAGNPTTLGSIYRSATAPQLTAALLAAINE